MSDLTDYEGEARAHLGDASTNIATAYIDQGLKAALRQLSNVQPFDRIDTVTIATAGHEISLSMLSAPATVDRVWTPYTAVTPEVPPLFRDFQQWSPTLLFLPDHYCSLNDVARVFYHTPHTINGVLSATVTTPTDEQRGWITLGAAYYAVVAKQRELSGTINANFRVTRDLNSVAIRLGDQWLEFIKDEKKKRNNRVKMGRITYSDSVTDLDYGLPAWMLGEAE